MSVNFENEEESDESPEEQTNTYNIVVVCDGYDSLKQTYLDLVATYKLEFYHKLKFKQKKRITELEARIIAVEKEISLKDAKKMAYLFNSYIRMIKNEDVQKCLNKLTKRIHSN